MMELSEHYLYAGEWFCRGENCNCDLTKPSKKSFKHAKPQQTLKTASKASKRSRAAKQKSRR